MSTRFERVSGVLLTVSALTIAALLLKREFFLAAQPPRGEPAADGPLLRHEDWRTYLKTGITTGSAQAPIQIIVFSDFECPNCARFELTTMASIKAKYGGSVATTFIHFPLPYHRFARPTAVAAECADSQERFGEFVSVAFTKQDSLGVKTWNSFADEAGIPDMSLFNECIHSTQAPARIDAGFKLSTDLSLSGTPTVMVNGWQFRRPPSFETMTESIDRILQGMSPND